MVTRSLFDTPEVRLAGLMRQVKTAMNQAVRDSGLSREHVLDLMNEMAGAAGVRLTGGSAKRLGLPTLEKWLNPAEQEHHPGVLAINIFCAVLKDPRPLSIQIDAQGLGVMDGEDRRLRDYGRACLAEREARKRKRELEANL